MSIIPLILLALSMHACNARCLGLTKKEASTGNHQDITVSSLEGLKNGGGVKTYWKEEEIAIRDSEEARVVVDLQKVIQEPVKTEVSKRQLGRSMLGSSTPHETQKPVGSKQADDDSVEHIDVMDYAQPHRKPPIHNEKS